MSTIKTNTIQPTQAGNNLVFANGTAVEKMRITDGGLVGIGTASPTVALDVAGAISTYGDVRLTGPGALISLAYQSNSDIYRGILGWNTLQLGNNGPNRIVAGNTTVGGGLDFYVNNTTPLLTNSTPSNGRMAMSIDADGSIVLGNNGYGVTTLFGSPVGVCMEAGNSAVSKTIHKHHIHILGPTVVGDCWYIGEIEMDTVSNAPTNVTITHACHVNAATEACVFNFATDYSNDGASDSTFSSWKQVPSISRSQWESQAYSNTNGSNFSSLDSAFTIDMRKKRNGGVQLRLRACYGSFSNTPANSTTNLCTFVIETTGYFQKRFVRGTSGTNTAPVAPFALNANEYGTAVAGYVGKKSYEFPVSNGTGANGQHRATASGLFINGWGGTHVRSSLSDVLRVESLHPGEGATSVMTWYRNGTICGHVQILASSMAIVTSSDHRLKNNVRPLVSALDKISKLNPVSFNWIKGDEPDTGFIAHEVQSVIPNAACGEKDAVKEDGSILPQSVSSEKLIAWLVAGMKELKAIVEAQAARIAALEGK